MMKNKFTKTALICSLILISCGNVHAQIISTIAGTTQGYSGDGGLATSAQLDNPFGVFVDASGNVYIADANNNRIRKVSASTGIISTIAGTGVAGFSGDGGLATSAQLKSPYGVFVDASGNVYIADRGNNSIRKINATTGIISTIAGTGAQFPSYSGDGGAATSAQLSYPNSVVVDAAGDVYFVDTENHRIRKVTASTGIISTIAGNGTSGYSGDGALATNAQLGTPRGVSLDAFGNVYIADYGNDVIRKVSASTGIISTIAGTGTSGYSGDGGAAPNAQLSPPHGVCLDASGNVYIADYLNNRIRKVSASTGIINTIAGGGVGGLGDGGPATSAQLYRPAAVYVDASGNMFIADKGNNSIRKINADHTGIEDIQSQENTSFNFFPNPANNNVIIEFTLQTKEEVSISVIDLTGKIEKTVSKACYAAGEHEMDIDLGELKSGFYFIRYSTPDKTIDKKLIKL